MRHIAVGALLMLAGLPPIARAQCPDGTPPPCGRAGSPAGANSVGVLRFVNVTRDSGTAYLSDGLATEIATSLARVPRLEVRSPGTVRAAQRGADVAPVEVGRRLNVRYVVEGDFQRGGDRVRISVRLVALPSGTQRWSNAWTRPLTDLLSVQEEIAGAVATAIAGELLPQDRSALAVRPTRSGTAWDHYLRGNFYLARRDSASYVRALSEYQAAYRADTTFTDALARQASVYQIALGSLGLSRDTLLARATAAAETALRRAPNSAVAWMAMSHVRSLREPRTRAGVEEALARALALDSNNADLLHQAGVDAYYSGNATLSAARYRRALAIEPLRAVTLNNLGTMALLEGRYAEALAWTDSVYKVDPDYAPFRWRAFRLLALMHLGDTSGARAELARWPSLPGMAFMTTALADIAVASPADVDSIALRRLALVQSRGGNNWVTHGAMADLMILRGASRAAILTVLEAAPVRDAQMHTYLRSRGFDAVRDEPRFQRLYAETAP